MQSPLDLSTVLPGVRATLTDGAFMLGGVTFGQIVDNQLANVMAQALVTDNNGAVYGYAAVAALIDAVVIMAMWDFMPPQTALLSTVSMMLPQSELIRLWDSISGGTPPGLSERKAN